MSVEKSDDLKYTFSTSVTLYSGSLYSGSLYSGSLYSGSLYSGSLYSGSLYSGSTDHKTQFKTAQVNFTRDTFAYPLMSDFLCAMFMYVMLVFFLNFYFK